MSSTQLLNEVDTRFNTGSMRNIYSPDVACANELAVDQIAQRLRKDPYTFRMAFLKNAKAKRCLKAVAEAGGWGRPLPKGVTQGIAVHTEYKGATAVLVELDTPARDGRPLDLPRGHRPRVTKAVIAVDAGLVVNPRGLEAQMMGGVADGIALALTSACHLRDGHFLEAQLGQLLLHAPVEHPARVPVRRDAVGRGAARRRRRGRRARPPSRPPRARTPGPPARCRPRFPVNHDTVSFTPKSFVPPVPESPVDGLSYTY